MHAPKYTLIRNSCFSLGVLAALLLSAPPLVHIQHEASPPFPEAVVHPNVQPATPESNVEGAAALTEEEVVEISPEKVNHPSKDYLKV